MIATQSQSMTFSSARLHGATFVAVKPGTAVKSEVILSKALRRAIQAAQAEKLEEIASKDPKPARLYVRSEKNTPIEFRLLARGIVSLTSDNQLKFETEELKDKKIPNRQIVIIPDSFIAHYKKSFSAKITSKQIKDDVLPQISEIVSKRPKSPYSLACQTFAKELTKKQLDYSLPVRSSVAVLNTKKIPPALVCFGEIESSSEKFIKLTWERWTQQPGQKASTKALREGEMENLVIVPLAYLKHEIDRFKNSLSQSSTD